MKINVEGIFRFQRSTSRKWNKANIDLWSNEGSRDAIRALLRQYFKRWSPEILSHDDQIFQRF